MDWVPGRTWGWLGPSGSLCNELSIHSFQSYANSSLSYGWIGSPRCNCFFFIGSRGEHGVGWAPRGLFVTNSSFIHSSCSGSLHSFRAAGGPGESAAHNAVFAAGSPY
jgi:hypothetical protein